MTLSSIWDLLTKAETIAGLVISIAALWGYFKKKQTDMESGESSPKHVELLPYPKRPRNPIPGNLENGDWVFVYGEKKYSIGESTYIWGTGSGLSVMNSSHRKEKESIKDFPSRVTRVPDLTPRCEFYQTKDSKIFFLIRTGCFVGEYSKEEVREWLNAHGASSEAYERAEIELRVA